MKYFVMLVISVFVAIGVSVANASSTHHNFICCGGSNGQAGMAGADGVDGSDGIDGSDGLDGGSYNDDSITRMIAVGSAMASIPNISHDSEHSHSNVGVGIGGNSDNVGIAIGINHMQDDMSFKANVGVSGSETVYGVGAGINF